MLEAALDSPEGPQAAWDCSTEHFEALVAGMRADEVGWLIRRAGDV